MSLQVTQMFVPANKYSRKCPYAMTPKYIVVHNTANDASAMSEVSYMIGNNNEVSYHYAVDDTRAVQGIPENRNAWHCGATRGNRNAIGVEICYSRSGGARFEKAEDNAAILVASLLKKYGWGIDKVQTHQMQNGKYCPHRTLDMGWERFLNKVRKELGQAQVQVSPSNPTPAPSKPSYNGGKEIVFTYSVKAGGRLYPEVKNLSDWAGKGDGTPITDIAIKVNKGSVKYRVHVLGGNWLPWVTGYNWNDHNNGYAGNGKSIDAIQVYYNTPSDYAAKYGYQKAQYRVSSLRTHGFYSWQFDTETGKGMDGYAGALGVEIDKFQLY